MYVDRYIIDRYNDLEIRFNIIPDYNPLLCQSLHDGKDRNSNIYDNTLINVMIIISRFWKRFLL